MWLLYYSSLLLLAEIPLSTTFGDDSLDREDCTTAFPPVGYVYNML